MTDFPARPAEWLHDKACLAHALICAIENMRDDDSRGVNLDLAFRMDVQANLPLTWADEYLTSGTTTCLCEAPWPEDRVVTLRQPTKVFGKPGPHQTLFIDGSEFLVRES